MNNSIATVLTVMEDFRCCEFDELGEFIRAMCKELKAAGMLKDFRPTLGVFAELTDEDEFEFGFEDLYEILYKEVQEYGVR